MGIAHAMWTHGHSVTIEQFGSIQAVNYLGFIAELVGKPNHYVWVHYAIPTPVIVSDKRLKADKVLIRYRTEPGDNTHVTNVHVYDAEKQIGAFGGLGPSTAFVTSESNIDHKPEVFWGIGVSIRIQFSSLAYPKFQISSVGCDFLE